MERIKRHDRSNCVALLRLMLALSVSISLHAAALALPGPGFGNAAAVVRTQITLPIAAFLEMPSSMMLPAAPIPDMPAVTREGQSAMASVESVDATYYTADELDVFPVLMRPVQRSDVPAVGYVRVLVRIDASGRVTDARIFDSSTPYREAHAAMLAVRRTLFAAARKNGRAVRSEVVIELAGRAS